MLSAPRIKRWTLIAWALVISGCCSVQAQLVHLPVCLEPADAVASMPSAIPVSVVQRIEPHGSCQHWNDSTEDDCWRLRILPDGLIYKTPLAGAKESRLGGEVFHEKNAGWFWGATIGNRFGLFRYGNDDVMNPEGFQVDIDGSAQVRLDIDNELDVSSVDFRGGIIGTWGSRVGQTRFGYYHISSHLGDEFLLKNPTFPRLNFVRDVLIWGQSVDLTEYLRIYAETGYAFSSEVSQPWEFQFGFDWIGPQKATCSAAPFLAMNGHLREEVSFGGNVTLHAGWAWRATNSRRLLRLGLFYQNGKSVQFSFFDEHEQQFGIGSWFDP